MIASLAAFCRDFFTFNIVRGIELYKFAAASDNDLFGSTRPGYSKIQRSESLESRWGKQYAVSRVRLN
jgi:hypothetical protein